MEKLHEFSKAFIKAIVFALLGIISMFLFLAAAKLGSPLLGLAGVACLVGGVVFAAKR